MLAMENHQLRLLFIAIATVLSLVAVVVLALLGEGNEMAQTVLVRLEGALGVLIPALLDAAAVRRRQQRIGG